MKKMICLCLALVLCLAAVHSFAETAADFSGDQVTVTIPTTGTENLTKVDLSGSAKALTSTDDVVNQNGVYTVKTASGLTLQLNAAGMPYMVLTQNYYASLDVYSRMNDDDAVEFMDHLISNNLNFYILDSYKAFNAIIVRTPGSDGLSQHVRRLSMLNENEVTAVANALANAWGETDYSLYDFNGNVWIQLGANVLTTIINSEYVQVYYYPNGDEMTEDDYADFTDFMNVLTIE